MSGEQKALQGTAAITANGRVDRNVGRLLEKTMHKKRDRHMMSRYDWPEDRKDFRRWRLAAGPCRRPYWYFDEMRGRLTIELHKGDKVMCYDLTMIELQMARLGWRRLVAQAIRQVRAALPPNA